MIDYLSDTVTKPTEEMRAAMAHAVVGDDVYFEDPTAARLEELAAEMLGKQAACFMPSGTMCNLVAIMTHCPRGREILVGNRTDIYNYEAGGPSVLGGVVYHPLPNQLDGTIAIADLRGAIRDAEDYQFARAGLVCLENPHNECGGRPLSLDYLAEVNAFARDFNLPIHMDGARIFSAATALGVPAAQIAAYADTLQFCLSKNLAAPVGSILAGTAEFIEDARRLRKMLGGGMRQVGILAAAGIVALETMVPRLAIDHRRARRLAEGLIRIPGIRCNIDEVQTNMVFFSLDPPSIDQDIFLGALLARGIRMAELGRGRIRAALHYQIEDKDIDETISVIRTVLTTSGVG